MTTPTTTGTGEGSPLRADARRNRARLLEAAESVFATRGLTASTDEVAKEAGVGIGTLFRHFPTKEALLRAVLIARLDGLCESARTLAADEQPGPAFFAFFTMVVDSASAKNAYADALEEAGVDVQDAFSEVGQSLKDALESLLVSAQKAGAVRGDIGVAELKALLVGASRAIEQTPDDPAVRSRTLSVFTDGLRPVTFTLSPQS
jgi:AcrR family transcriptional regulator